MATELTEDERPEDEEDVEEPCTPDSLPPVAQGLASEFADLTTEQVRVITGLDRGTVLKYLREGRLEGYMLGKSWKIPPENVRKFRRQLLQEASLENQARRLRQQDPHAGWEVRRCPYTNDPMLVHDETNREFWGGGARLQDPDGKTGRKTGFCPADHEECQDNHHEWGEAEPEPYGVPAKDEGVDEMPF